MKIKYFKHVQFKTISRTDPLFSIAWLKPLDLCSNNLSIHIRLFSCTKPNYIKDRGHPNRVQRKEVEMELCGEAEETLWLLKSIADTYESRISYPMYNSRVRLVMVQFQEESDIIIEKLHHISATSPDFNRQCEDIRAEWYSNYQEATTRMQNLVDEYRSREALPELDDNVSTQDSESVSLEQSQESDWSPYIRVRSASESTDDSATSETPLGPTLNIPELLQEVESPTTNQPYTDDIPSSPEDVSTIVSDTTRGDDTSELGVQDVGEPDQDNAGNVTGSGLNSVNTEQSSSSSLHQEDSSQSHSNFQPQNPSDPDNESVSDWSDNLESNDGSVLPELFQEDAGRESIEGENNQSSSSDDNTLKRKREDSYDEDDDVNESNKKLKTRDDSDQLSNTEHNYEKHNPEKDTNASENPSSSVQEENKSSPIDYVLEKQACEPLDPTDDWDM